MEEVERRIQAIRHDRQHGAMFLAVEAVWTVAEAATACGAGQEWEACIRVAASRTAQARPAMAAVRNAAFLALGRLLSLGPRSTAEAYRDAAQSVVADLHRASDAAAERAASLVPPDASVLTCSYSSSVTRTLKIALDAGKSPRALVAEAGQEEHGRRLTTDLEANGIQSQVIGIEALQAAVRESALAIIGADAITPSCVVNGAPSLSLAQAAHGNVPLYVVCETIKLIEEVETEPGFDRIPISLVTAIVTEDGLLSADDVARRLGDMRS